jgi:hypothetical protein
MRRSSLRLATTASPRSDPAARPPPRRASGPPTWPRCGHRLRPPRRPRQRPPLLDDASDHAPPLIQAERRVSVQPHPVSSVGLSGLSTSQPPRGPRMNYFTARTTCSGTTASSSAPTALGDLHTLARARSEPVSILHSWEAAVLAALASSMQRGSGTREARAGSGMTLGSGRGLLARDSRRRVHGPRPPPNIAAPVECPSPGTSGSTICHNAPPVAAPPSPSGSPA